MNEWRFYRFRPKRAHLWTETVGRLWRSECGRKVVDIIATTAQLHPDDNISKCRICINHEIRRKESK
jgi:hypothetical protein